MTFTMMPLIGAGGYAESGNTANTVVTRTTMLDLTSTAGKYMATDGTENTVDFTNTSVIDSAEGWSWNHETKTLTLAGARIVVTEPTFVPSPIQIFKNGYYYGVLLPGDVTVVLTEGTENIIQAGDAAGEIPEGIVIGSVGMGDANNLNKSVTICGSGKLTVKGGKPAKGGNKSGRISSGIYSGNVIVKDSAELELYGDMAENTDAAAYSRGIGCSHMTITDNAQVTARGGHVKAVNSRESSGISASQSLIINGRASLKAYGGDVTKNPGASNEWSTSMGICAAGFEASENASVYAYGGRTYGDMAGSSMGVYIHKIYREDSEAKLSDNAFLYAEGGQAGGSSFGIYGDRDPQQQSHLTIKDNAYMKAVGKENGGEGVDRSNGIATYGMTINGGTVIASAEAENEGSNSSIAAISLLTQPPLPTYKEGLTPTVTAGKSEAVAESAGATSAETYTNRWVKIQTTEPVYAIAAIPSELDFGAVKTGYTQPAAKTVTLKNTGNETVSVTGIQSAENSNYIITGNLPAEIGPRETADFTVQPKEALAEGTYNETVTILGSNDTKSELQLKFSVIKNSSGGGYIPPVQKPDIQAGEGVKVTLSADGKTATITIEEEYELDDVVLNGTSKGKVTEIKDLRTGDKLVVTAKKKDSGADDAELDKKVKELISGLEFKARSQKLKNGNIRVKLQGQFDEIKELEKLGYTVKYKFYRSTKKSSGYKATVTKNVPLYINTAGRDGVMYYYKANIMIYDKDGELIAQTAIKQCKYANRRWSK